MLFCPPLPPQRIDPGATLTIGRHPRCEFSLRRSDVSRRHAEVRRVDDHFVLHDLGSTNGTFLNGERVEEDARLTAGDRIEIGSNTITFCEIDATIEEANTMPAEAQTMIFERAPTREAFQGELAEIPSYALLQVLEMGAKTGVLEVRGASGIGRIWFRGGYPVDAETEKLAGFDAAVAVVNTDKGEFRFEAQPIECEQTIRASVTALLLESSRQQDENGALGL